VAGNVNAIFYSAAEYLHVVAKFFHTNVDWLAGRRFCYPVIADSL